MAVIASGCSVEADTWQLSVHTNSDTGVVFTMVNVQLADGSTIWGTGCGDSLPPDKRLNTCWGVGDRGPRTFIARVTSEVRAVVITLSDGTREDLVLHPVSDAVGLRVAVLVYPRALDVHRVDLFGAHGEPLTLDA